MGNDKHMRSDGPAGPGKSEHQARPPGVALNFRVAADFKRDFKVAAAVRGVTQSELLRRIFQEWRVRDGSG
jgi:hypothetical protein